jgi:deazaflavin-dependent oxidoreductase (nitroreductase family)
MPLEIEAEYLYLTTTGRQSGLPREIEIWYTELGGRFYLIAERREQSHWVQNLQRQPNVSFRLGAENFQGRARIIDPVREPALCSMVRTRFDQKYGWSDGLVVELTSLGATFA